MNLYLLIGGVVTAVGAVVGAYFTGVSAGTNAQIAKQAAVEEIVREVKEATAQVVADNIAKIEIRNTTIQGKVEREIRTNTVYAECKHTDDSMRYINEALTGQQQPGSADKGKLPRTDKTGR